MTDLDTSQYTTFKLECKDYIELTLVPMGLMCADQNEKEVRVGTRHINKYNSQLNTCIICTPAYTVVVFWDMQHALDEFDGNTLDVNSIITNMLTGEIIDCSPKLFLSYATKTRQIGKLFKKISH